MILEVHQLMFKYDVCFEEYMDPLLRSVSGITLEGTKPMRKTERSGSKKNLNNNLTYLSIQKNIELATTLLLQRIQVFTILEAPYI